ncbi:glycosyltransferase 87 family protein [Nevskia sp.]|uniref:glycosyltransferase 87 family protein n=1 Tax=Nevskia sp. TaxID=1929292 RepID=UPI0025CD69E7|nr:glycosyltransferase 87 family protein [Nevskia sp.]
MSRLPPALIASGLAFVGLAALGAPLAQATASHHGSAYLLLHGLMTAAMLVAWQHTDSRPSTLRWLLLTGLAARLLLLPAAPFTTHDVDRYLWDGAVAVAGFDPYRVAPADAVVTALRSIWPTPPEHAAYATLYPPGALALFALAASSGPTLAPLLWKLMVTAASLATLWLGQRLLAAWGRERHLALLALSPLLVLESGIGGHVDSFAALALVAALLAATTARWRWAGFAIGLAALVKLLPVLALLPLAVFAGRGAWRFLASAALTMATAYGLALALGLVPLGSLPLFFEHWRGGAPLFAAAVAVLPLSAALAGLAVIALLMLVRSALLARQQQLAASLPWALAAPLLVSPVLFPWYLLPLVPLAAAVPSWTLLTALSLAPASYEVLDAFDRGDGWHPAVWPVWLLGIGLLLALVADVLRLRRQPSSAR